MMCAGMTAEQKDALVAAYLGIRVFEAMTRAAGLTSAEQQAKDVLTDLETAFPFIAKHGRETCRRRSA